MIVEQLRRFSAETPAETFIVEHREPVSFREIEDLARGMDESWRGQVKPGSNLYLYAKDSAKLVSALVASQYCGATVCILNRSYTADDLAGLSRRLPPGQLISDAGPVESWPWPTINLESARCPQATTDYTAAASGGILVLTTGTTGLPKPVLYSWDRLAAQIRLSGSEGRNRWALLYPLNHFAGLQVLLHALKNGFSLAIPRSRQFGDVFDCLAENEVESASATPTFWRVFTGLLSSGDARRLRLRQITLGGEPVTADILDRLRRLFPDARLTHVYATTELGSCFAVNDGLPGFPASYLDSAAGNVELRIHEGEMYVRSNLGMTKYADGSPEPKRQGDWTSTGDAVEVRNGRVHFLGRVSETVNVGGIKVYPPTVEQEIRKVPGVRDARVYAKANPVTGQIVGAEVEIDGGASAETVLAAIREACRTRLSRYEQPRELRVVPELRRSNEKLVRR